MPLCRLEVDSTNMCGGARQTNKHPTTPERVCVGADEFNLGTEPWYSVNIIWLSNFILNHRSPVALAWWWICSFVFFHLYQTSNSFKVDVSQPDRKSVRLFFSQSDLLPTKFTGVAKINMVVRSSVSRHLVPQPCTAVSKGKPSQVSSLLGLIYQVTLSFAR